MAQRLSKIERAKRDMAYIRAYQDYAQKRASALRHSIGAPFTSVECNLVGLIAYELLHDKGAEQSWRQAVTIAPTEFHDHHNQSCTVYQRHLDTGIRLASEILERDCIGVQNVSS